MFVWIIMDHTPDQETQSLVEHISDHQANHFIFTGLL